MGCQLARPGSPRLWPGLILDRGPRRPQLKFRRGWFVVFGAKSLRHHAGHGTARRGVTGCPGIESLGKPTPAHGAEQRILGDLRVQFCLNLRDDPERPDPISDPSLVTAAENMVA